MSSWFALAFFRLRKSSVIEKEERRKSMQEKTIVSVFLLTIFGNWLNLIGLFFRQSTGAKTITPSTKE
jgi:hypothetical protein